MSNNPHNQLTDAQAERLYLLLEELGEAQHAIGKVLRHGYDSRYEDGLVNRAALERELGHVLAAVDLLTAPGTHDLANIAVTAAAQEKRASYAARTYLHHQAMKGVSS